jgi:predicted anti-sigma-YlaC factor YlaD
MESDTQQMGLACNQYEGLLADRVSGECGSADATRVAAHLQECSNCRQALEDARAGARFLRLGLPLLEKSTEPPPEFARTVMARIRMEKDRRTAERTGFWQPFVSLAWRFAATAMVALVILLTYAVRGHNALRRGAAIGQSPLADVFAPDPTRIPANQDEILIMVAETDHANGND